MKQTLLPIFLWFSFWLPAQEAYLKPPDLFADMVTINHVLDSLKSKLTAYVIYQKQSQSIRILSYLICNFGAYSGFWIFSRDSILEYKTLNTQTIFSYQDISLTGVTTQENRLKFKPPLLSVLNNEIVIYYNEKRKIKMYFEYGRNITTYEPLPRKEQYRTKWIHIIRKTIS